MTTATKTEAMSATKAAMYKTAYSKTWGVFVRIDAVTTEDGSFVFWCSGTDRNGDKFCNWTFTERELSDFCL